MNLTYSVNIHVKSNRTTRDVLNQNHRLIHYTYVIECVNWKWIYKR